jgi:UDP-2,4-diacetamido-2,4,6-trideoxy-beta-L-altropyranose hydrolase
MKILFRADASLRIGSGHVMRCLTLADALARGGADCAFICRRLEGNLNSQIRNRGYRVYELPDQDFDVMEDVQPDARHSRDMVEDYGADWVLVDHYGIDAAWEEYVVQPGVRLLVIDDLADRRHSADILVDQTYGRTVAEYSRLVPVSCNVLTGSSYAILRPEFSVLRESSLARRRHGSLRNVLVSMGGSDVKNATGQVLALLTTEGLASRLGSIVVVLGGQSIWSDEISALSSQMPVPTSLQIDVDNVAELMVDADLAIGAGGTTAWERCCLGLPAILLTLADNQLDVCGSLDRVGAAIHVGGVDSGDWKPRLVEAMTSLLGDSDLHMTMSRRASEITDGLGTDRVCQQLLRMSYD